MIKKCKTINKTNKKKHQKTPVPHVHMFLTLLYISLEKLEIPSSPKYYGFNYWQISFPIFYFVTIAEKYNCSFFYCCFATILDLAQTPSSARFHVKFGQVFSRFFFQFNFIHIPFFTQQLYVGV